MPNVKHLTLIYETVLIKEYNESTMKKILQKYREENRGNVEVTDELITHYVERFDEIKHSPRLINYVKEHFPKITNPLDILQYDWHTLEASVDQFPEKMSFTQRKANQAAMKNQAVDDSLVYDAGGIQVYRADSMKKCIEYGRNKFRPEPYSFCISRPDNGGGNLYRSYRFRGDQSAMTFYFVRDNNKPLTDKYHLMVLGARKDGAINFTNANNEGDKTLGWDELIKQHPELAPLRNIVVPTPFTEEEQIEYASGNASAKDFHELSYKAKQAYLSMNSKQIYGKDYLNLPPELQNTYVNSRENISDLLLPFADSQETSKALDEAIKTNNADIVLNNPVIMQGSKQAFARYKELLIRVLEKIADNENIW